MAPISKKFTAANVPVAAIQHKDGRANIPTEELRDFVPDNDSPPTMLYPRDPSLDPQLVWKGKDEQDRQDLAVPVVPIYIQEKIEPRAIIEGLRRETAGPSNDDGQLDMFATFDGPEVELDTKLDFYEHENAWSNRMILGDSLLVMTSLAEKEGLKGKVQTIYIDPPYGIKFGSNWQVSTRNRDVKDGKFDDATRQPEQIRAFRDTWSLGVHSYLSYLRDRFVVARSLLTNSGSVFVQIGDENLHFVRAILDEVFGAEGFIAVIPFRKTGGLRSQKLDSVFDFLLWYANDRQTAKYRQLFGEKQPGEPGAMAYRYVLRDGQILAANSEAMGRNERLCTHGDVTSQGNEISEYSFLGRKFRGGFKYRNPDGLDKLATAGRLAWFGKTLRVVRYLDDFTAFPLNQDWSDTGVSGFASDKRYVVETSTKVVERCLLMTTDPGDLVLDPTCGSGTTAFVAEQWGRRWITIDTSRVALALARTRLMAAKYPYYLLADSEQGIAKEKELTGVQPPNYQTEGDIRKGFVYKRVPHVTLKSIANNPDIHEGMTREEIDRAIAKHAETETLFDQPYTDSKRVRVSGKFTVESLSPHRVLSPADDDQDGVVSPAEGVRQTDFATDMLENLRRAGVQNTKLGERLKFDRLDPHPGSWVQASGEYTDANGQTRRVAVTIGPEHGTVGANQVKQAAKEAVQGLGHDLLLVCGFAFDAQVGEEAKRYGKLDVIPVKMNPDLMMSELLKKSGAGNLFMIFGEPDVEVKTFDHQAIVELKGVDIYDPTTGEIRSSTTNDIACWFIDTAYDEESFFVRHAYFTGGNEPYDSLKKALRAEIDEAAWSSLSTTVSRPFLIPDSRTIAVKVINHYGDEVMKVVRL